MEKTFLDSFKDLVFKSKPVDVGRLTKSSFLESKDKLFGLTLGQYSRYDTDTLPESAVQHNAGWYNSAGERTGWGDLSYKNLATIAHELEDGEVFIVLPEYPSRGWQLQENQKKSFDAEAPGLNYVSQYAEFILVKGKIFIVTKNKEQFMSERSLPPINIQRHYTQLIEKLKGRSENVEISSIPLQKAKNTIRGNSIPLP